jgi:hypothetical protein
LRHRSSIDAPASTASRAQRFVTFAKRPSCKSAGRGESIKVFLPPREAKYFRETGWTFLRKSPHGGKLLSSAIFSRSSEAIERNWPSFRRALEGRATAKIN